MLLVNVLVLTDIQRRREVRREHQRESKKKEKSQHSKHCTYDARQAEALVSLKAASKQAVDP